MVRSAARKTLSINRMYFGVKNRYNGRLCPTEKLPSYGLAAPKKFFGQKASVFCYDRRMSVWRDG